MQTVPQQGHGIRVPMQVPLIGQQRGPSQQPTQDLTQEEKIKQLAGQLSLGWYSKEVSEYLARIDKNQEFDLEYLREVARRCHSAAIAYFEGLGIIEYRGNQERA